MKEVEYWFMTRMYTMGILALSVAVIQVCYCNYSLI